MANVRGEAKYHHFKTNITTFFEHMLIMAIVAPSQVTAMDGAVIRIHFPGWSPKHDRWLSLQSDWKSLAPINLLSGRQRETGGPLNPEQATATYHYLLTGALPPGIDIGNSDSEYSVTSSDAENSIMTSRTGSRGNNSSRLKSPPPPANSIVKKTDNYSALYVGLKVEVQDLFRTKLNEGVRAKWRVAEIISIRENIVRIHFVGWDPKWDENIDISIDRGRLRDYAIVDQQSKSKVDSGKNGVPKKKEIRKSFNSYDRYPKQLTPVPEVSERSSPSISNASSGFVSLDQGSKSELFFEAVSGALKATHSGLAVLVEDVNENLVSNKGSNKEKGYVTPKLNYDGIASQSPKNKKSVLALKGDLSTKNNSTSSSSTISVEEKILLACIVADHHHHKKGADNAAISRSSFASVGSGGGGERSYRTQGQSSAPDTRISQKKDAVIKDKLLNIGLFVKKVTNDGNSLFRAVSHQMYLTETRHLELRQLCCKHMKKHKARFENFCTVDYDQHVRNIQQPGNNGDHLEIRVLEEVLDRIFYVFCADTKLNDFKASPSDINEDEANLLNGVEVIRLLSLDHGVYNSVVDDLEPFSRSDRRSSILVNHRVQVYEAILNTGNSSD